MEETKSVTEQGSAESTKAINFAMHPFALIIVSAGAFFTVSWVFFTGYISLGDAIFGWIVTLIFMMTGIGHLCDNGSEETHSKRKPKRD